MKLTIPILIIVAIGLLSGCALGMPEINVDIEYFWNDDGTMLTINYTLFNSGRTDLNDIVVTFGADLTTDGIIITVMLKIYLFLYMQKISIRI